MLCVAQNHRLQAHRHCCLTWIFCVKWNMRDRKFLPIAKSLRPRRQRSRTWATAQRTLAEERKWWPNVHQAWRDDRFSSRFLSLLLIAAIVPTCPTPLLPCSRLSLSFSLARFDALKDVLVLNVHNMLPILGEQPRHLSYRPFLCGFSLWLVGLPVLRLGVWLT